MSKKQTQYKAECCDLCGEHVENGSGNYSDDETLRVCDDCVDFMEHPVTCAVREHVGSYLELCEELEEDHTKLLRMLEQVLNEIERTNAPISKQLMETWEIAVGKSKMFQHNARLLHEA